MCVRKFANEVHAEDIPTTLRDGDGWSSPVGRRRWIFVQRQMSHVWYTDQRIWTFVAPVAPGGKLQGFSSVQGGLQPWCHGVASNVRRSSGSFGTWMRSRKHSSPSRSDHSDAGQTSLGFPEVSCSPCDSILLLPVRFAFRMSLRISRSSLR